jgi:hypothetical protein
MIPSVLPIAAMTSRRLRLRRRSAHARPSAPLRTIRPALPLPDNHSQLTPPLAPARSGTPRLLVCAYPLRLAA